MLRRPANLKVTDEMLDEMVKLYFKGYEAKEILKQIKSKYDISIGKSTLYRNLKKRIKLRSISETLKIQNRINLPINEIIRLYIEEKYSIKELAEKFSRNWYTIRKILIENNVKLKDRGEINHLFRTKFVKPKVSLTECEKAYIAGLVIGDFAVYKKSKYTLRITTGTTIQSFAKMIEETFNKYGHVMVMYDKYNSCYKVMVDVDLESFNFLTKIKENYLYIESLSNQQFLSFLAGFIDAEGSIGINKRESRNCIEFEVSIANTDIKLLNIINSKLIKIGFHSKIIKGTKKGTFSNYKGKLFFHNFDQYRISIVRKSEIKELLEHLPIRHPDKLVRKELVLFCIKNNIRKLKEFLTVEKQHQPLTLPKATNFTTGLEIPAKDTASTT
jgi:intein-encoded DNA endonuclease-like protein